MTKQTSTTKRVDTTYPSEATKSVNDTELTYALVARKKTILQVSLWGCFLLTLGLISVFAFQEGAGSTPQNTLSVSGPWEFSSVDPSKQGYVFTRMQIIETLLDVNDSGELTAGLATEWKISPDGLDWTLTLRDHVVFHDGQKFNADAAVRNLTMALNKHGALRKAPIAKITAINDKQVQITLNKPYGALAALLTNYATAMVSPNGLNDDGSVNQLHGTGPYRLHTFEPPHKLLASAFPHYWGEKANIPFVSYLTGHRAESRILQAKSGEADLVFTLDPAMISQLHGQNSVQVHSHVVSRTLLIKLNNLHPYLKDHRAREALSRAIDRSSIARNVLHTPGSQTLQLLPASMGQWHLKNTSSDEYDLDKAKQLLADLGWQRNPQGQLMREEKPFTLTMMTYADRPELTAVATAIQAQWALLGIELNVDVTNSSMIPAGHNDGTLEVALIARNYGASADPLPLIYGDFADGGGDWGAMHWRNGELDSTLNALNHRLNIQTDTALSQKVAALIVQERPVLPLANYHQHTAVNQRVKHFKFDPFERNYFLNQMELQ